jgi:hypothetical protein
MSATPNPPASSTTPGPAEGRIGALECDGAPPAETAGVS